MQFTMGLRHALLLAAGLLCAHVFAQAPPASGIYTCVDGKGRKLTSDRPIAECMDREQKVLNPSGTVRAKVGPTLTAREGAELEARQKQEDEARAMAAEEKRRERALLMRYPSREAHDRERAGSLSLVAIAVQGANRRIDELLEDRRKLDLEMEFYKKDPSKAPLTLRRQIDDVVQGIAAQKRLIAEQDKETQRINTRFDDELVRLSQLWQAQAAARPPLATVRKAP